MPASIAGVPRSAPSSDKTLPDASFASAIPCGGMCTPSFANVPYAEAISSGDTPVRSAPSAIDGNVSSGDVMPARCAIPATAPGPMSMTKRAYTALTERSVAVRRDIMPPLAPS